MLFEKAFWMCMLFSEKKVLALANCCNIEAGSEGVPQHSHTPLYCFVSDFSSWVRLEPLLLHGSRAQRECFPCHSSPISCCWIQQGRRGRARAKRSSVQPSGSAASWKHGLWLSLAPISWQAQTSRGSACWWGSELRVYCACSTEIGEGVRGTLPYPIPGFATDCFLTLWFRSSVLFWCIILDCALGLDFCSFSE